MYFRNVYDVLFCVWVVLCNLQAEEVRVQQEQLEQERQRLKQERIQLVRIL